MSLAETSPIRFLCGPVVAASTLSPASLPQSPLRPHSPSSPQVCPLRPPPLHTIGSSVELPCAHGEEVVRKHLFLKPGSWGNPWLPCLAGARWRRLPRVQPLRGAGLVLLTQCLRLEMAHRPALAGRRQDFPPAACSQIPQGFPSPVLASSPCLRFFHLPD